MRHVGRMLGLVALFSLTLTPAWALFESDKELASQARVSMADAIKTAEQAKPGKAVEVNMGKELMAASSTKSRSSMQIRKRTKSTSMPWMERCTRSNNLLL